MVTNKQSRYPPTCPPTHPEINNSKPQIQPPASSLQPPRTKNSKSPTITMGIKINTGTSNRTDTVTDVNPSTNAHAKNSRQEFKTLKNAKNTRQEVSTLKKGKKQNTQRPRKNEKIEKRKVMREMSDEIR
ncbi:hypothetical protein BHYA_0158g00310 [Botrytis hyacinthi]|uniref:Uncharacterized protein n=1 Tax=Botrytis hyacinthi TaxID=278943 RepID=A0A4Z1GGY5_9HELO|nr:hypothetical protein BHYA_0158g00310 [Botrytis hyacinthi]